jgi:hypothetical protein
MTVSGETDLARMLSSLDVSRRPGRFAFVTGDHPTLRRAALAMIDESEGPTLVVPVDEAREAGLAVDFEAAWLTLTVWSSLAAVGLTAAVSAALAGEGIACNVLAGYHHDHLLVPAERVDDAVRVLRGLAAS